jgi:hypothetical protein
MSMSYYAGKIKVVCADLMCFPVNPETLEATSTGCYDPWAWTDPDKDPVETISHGEWCLRLNKKWDRQLRDRYTGRR